MEKNSLHRKYYKRKRGSLCGWAIRTEKQDYLAHAEICFANLKHENYGGESRGWKCGPVTEFFFPIKHYEGRSVDKRKFYKFCNYIIKDSVFKDVFVTKNLRLKGFYLNVNESISTILVACGIIRYVWEYPDTLEIWCRLVKDGVSPFVAMIYSHFYQTKRENLYSKGIGGHNIFGEMTKEDIRSLYLKGLVRSGGWISKDGIVEQYRLNVTVHSKPYYENTPTFLKDIPKNITGTGWLKSEYILYSDVLKHAKEMQKWLK